MRIPSLGVIEDLTNIIYRSLDRIYMSDLWSFDNDHRAENPAGSHDI